MPYYGIEKLVDMKLKKERENCRKNEYLDEKFFLNQSNTEKSPIDIANEILEMLTYSKNDPNNIMARIDMIDEYMTDHGIWDNYLKYGVNKNVKKILESDILKDKSLEKRVQQIVLFDTDIEEERLVIETFFVNRMSKIINAISNHYFDDKKDFGVLFNKLLKNHNFSDLPNISEKDENFIKQLASKNSLNTEDINGFLAYTQLRFIQDEFYNIKHNNLDILCTKYKDHIMYDVDSNNPGTLLLSIKLDGYAFPIKFHVKSDKFCINNYDLKKDPEALKGLQAFPIKLNEEEKGAFDKIMSRKTRKYSKAIAPEVANESNTESRNSEEVHNPSKSKSTSKKAIYRENEEVIEEIIKNLIESGTLENINDEYRAKLSSISEKQTVKFDRILSSVKQFLISKDIDPEKIDVESAKMFCFMKILDRGFWNVKPELALNNYEKVYNELQIGGNEFFNGIDVEEDIEELKKYMKKIVPHKRITGAKTLDESEKDKTRGNKAGEKSNDIPIDEKTKHTEKDERIEHSKVEIEKTETIQQREEKEPTEETSQSEVIPQNQPKIEETQTNEQDKAPQEQPQIDKSETTEQDETSRLNNELESIIHSLRLTYTELTETEKELEKKTAELENQIINIKKDENDLAEKVAQIDGVLKSDDVDFLKEIGQFELLMSKRAELEKQLEEKRKEKEQAEIEIREKKEQANEIDKKKDKIKQEIIDTFREL